MELKYFPLFCRAHYPPLDNEPNDALIELGESFKQYLEERYVNNMEKLEPIWDISPKNIMLNINHPLKMKGYHPALLYHFSEFVKKTYMESGGNEQETN